jgi:hypothetical protein
VGKLRLPYLIEVEPGKEVSGEEFPPSPGDKGFRNPDKNNEFL